MPRNRRGTRGDRPRSVVQGVRQAAIQGVAKATVGFAVPTDRIFLLGSFRLRWRGEDILLPVGGQRVVAYLALAEHEIPRRSLIAALWPDVVGERAPANLRTTLWRDRRVVPALVQRDSQRLWLDPSVSVDAHDLDVATRAALDSPSTADPADQRS